LPGSLESVRSAKTAVTSGGSAPCEVAISALRPNFPACTSASSASTSAAELANRA